MDVSIMDPGPLGMLLGSLLHLKGVPVSFQPSSSAPPGGRIRVNLPDGRLLIEGIGAETAPPSAAFLLAMEGSGGARRDSSKRAARRAGDGQGAVLGAVVNGWQEAPPPMDAGTDRWEACLVLADPVMLDTACVELPEPGPAIVAPRGSRVAALVEPLRAFGFSLHWTEDIGAYLNSYRLLRLLDLPVAMCNTTRAHFLSYPEGRQIACCLLDEGWKAYRRLGGRLYRLPKGDPVELLRRLSRAPRSFDAARVLPGRAFNPALQCLMRGGALDPKGANRRIVELAAGTGLRLEWNWKISQKLSRVQGAGFFPDPVELLAAIG
jgi:hypothetical protein